MPQKLRVFVSWSGPTSRAVAVLLRDWLPNVIQAVEPWMADSDLEKGDVWLDKITAELQDAACGILVLTRDNLAAAWMLFEAGALSHRVGRRKVCPLLIGLESTELTFPLAQFQATRATEGEISALISTINAALGPDALTERALTEAYSVWWPKLKAGLEEIEAHSGSKPDEPLRSDRALLEETLDLVRGLALGRVPRFRQPRMPVVTCPSCGERSLRLGDGDPVCPRCRWLAPAEDAAEEYARAGNALWKHPKHGPEDDLGGRASRVERTLWFCCVRRTSWVLCDRGLPRCGEPLISSLAQGMRALAFVSVAAKCTMGSQGRKNLDF
jgi:hypothetical protein